MQIMHEQLNISGNNTIKLKWRESPHFTYPRHYHNEIEIIYVIQSYGNRYVGDSIEPFAEGDLVMLGRNLPHYWKNHAAFYKGDPALQVRAMVIHFPETIIKSENADFPEFRNIRDLIKRSERGIQFLEPIISQVAKRLDILFKLSGLERYIELLKILEIMATGEDYKLLASPGSEKSLPKRIDHRLEKVLNYLNKNFAEEQHLAELGLLVGMNDAAFCRFFKAGTSKTIVEYLHDLRIGHACKLLIEKDKTISEIAFECGFNNISNFNRVFKRKTNNTPSSYMKQMMDSE